MAIDFDGISTAIALRYAPGTLATPPGLGAVRSSSANLPGALGATPAVLIFPDRGTLEPGNGTRLGLHSFLARFYFAVSADLEREAVALRKWLTVLVDVHRPSASDISLGGLVVYVRTTSWRVGVIPYGTDDFAGIELGLSVRTSEAWT